MPYLLLALGTSLAGVLPLLIARRVRAACVVGALAFAAEALVYYANALSLVWPLLGFPGFCTAATWLVCAIVESFASRGRGGRRFSPLFLLPAGYLLALAGT